MLRQPSTRAIAVLAAAAAAALAAAGAVATASASPRAHAAAACSTSGLVAWLNTGAGGGAAGSFYYTLELTNLSGSTCTVSGYPGVSAVSLSGARIGSPASRTVGSPKTITLGNGASTKMTLRIVDVLNFPTSTCRPVWAAGLRVYPPGQTASRIVPGPFRACSRTGTIFMNIGPAS